MAPAADNWIVSETTSPIDYTPVTIATASSGGGPDGSTLQLSIQCRGGRTDLMIGGPALTRRGEDYVVSYAVNDGQPVVVAAGTPASGTGLAIRCDVVRLLASLPDRGEVAFRVTTRQGAALEGRYALAGLKIVLDRWPSPANGRPPARRAIAELDERWVGLATRLAAADSGRSEPMIVGMFVDGTRAAWCWRRVSRARCRLAAGRLVKRPFWRAASAPREGRCNQLR